MEGKKPTLSDPCKTPSVNKHHIHNEKQPTLKCLSFIIQTDFSNKESKQKNKSNFQQIKGVELWLTVLFTLLTRQKSHTDFAQRFLHHYVAVSLLPFFHHNRLLSDQEGQLLIPYHNLKFPSAMHEGFDGNPPAPLSYKNYRMVFWGAVVLNSPWCHDCCPYVTHLFDFAG